MRNNFQGDYFKSYLPAKPGIFFHFFSIFRVGIHALEISDPSLLLSYTMIAYSVYIETKASDRRYDLEVKG